MLYLFWVTHPPFGFDLYPLLSCWEHSQMFIQPVYVVKEYEFAEDGECPFCEVQKGLAPAEPQQVEQARQLSLFNEARLSAAQPERITL